MLNYKNSYEASIERLQRLNYNLNSKVSTGAPGDEIELIKKEIEKENNKLKKIIKSSK